jgi:DNA-binding NarL/FixJ family response regulator
MSDSACRVFVLYSHSLFAEGVMALLGRHQEVEVLGAEAGTESAVESVRQLRPDVVILEGAQGDPAYAIACLLRECPNTRLISLSLQDDKMEIYDNYQVSTPHPADLIQAILIARGTAGEAPVEG